METTAPTDVDVQIIDADLLVEEVSIDGMCGVY
ncbi:mycofactocin precursor MftA [Gryllotalpicola sp.]|nr:mycofactocin precursor MftA [Gryllotalpicola sp.]